MSRTLEQAIIWYEKFANACRYHNLTESQEEFEQLTAWLRELQERRKIDTCERCKHRTGGDRFWICQKCRRQYEDKYEAERRTDD